MRTDIPAFYFNQRSGQDALVFLPVHCIELLEKFKGEAYVPEDIAEKAVGVNEDIAVVVDELKAL